MEGVLPALAAAVGAFSAFAELNYGVVSVGKAAGARFFPPPSMSTSAVSLPSISRRPSMTVCATRLWSLPTGLGSRASRSQSGRQRELCTGMIYHTKAPLPAKASRQGAQRCRPRLPADTYSRTICNELPGAGKRSAHCHIGN